jgi:hypothetical protein
MAFIPEMKCKDIDGIDIADRMMSDKVAGVWPVLVLQLRWLIAQREFYSSLRDALQKTKDGIRKIRGSKINA